MKKQEINVYRAIQQTTENAIKTIDAVSDKIYDDRLALQTAGEALKYSKIRDEAVGELLRAGENVYRGSYVEDLARKSSIGYRTILNTSLSRIAELMIGENNTGIVNMERALNHNDNIGKETEELAHRLIDTQERHIADLKHYL